MKIKNILTDDKMGSILVELMSRDDAKKCYDALNQAFYGNDGDLRDIAGNVMQFWVVQNYFTIGLDGDVDVVQDYIMNVVLA